MRSAAGLQNSGGGSHVAADARVNFGVMRVKGRSHADEREETSTKGRTSWLA
jgi:hypothetical protein